MSYKVRHLRGVWVEDDHGRSVCKMVGSRADCVEQAILFAAAPDMQKALVDFFEMLDPRATTEQQNNRLFKAMRKALERSR